MSRRPPIPTAALLLVTLAASGCGKKGPPLAPFVRLPRPAASLAAERMGSTVYVEFGLPAVNADGSEPVDLARVEVYAVTTAPDAPLPVDLEDFIEVATPVAVVEAGPPRDPGEPPFVGPPSPFPVPPRPGDRTTVIERLTPDLFVPVDPERLVPGPPGGDDDDQDDDAAPRVLAPSVSMGLEPPLRRTYLAVGVTSRNRYGSESSRVSVPLSAAPAAPDPPGITYTEEAADIEAPVTPSARRPVQEEPTGTDLASQPIVEWPGPWTYEVYEVPLPGVLQLPRPLHSTPLETPSYSDPRVTFGIERCYVLRSVYAFASVEIRSEPSPPGCVTFRDTFPPAAPAGLTAVAADGVVNLIWGAGPDADVAGYLILRGASTGETLQPLTPTPIPGTSYRDTTVTPGQRYVYAVQAVDRGVPPNVSDPSEPIELTAR